MLNKHNLFESVFSPDETDIVLVMVDTPRERVADHDEWRERREMAEDWRQAFTAFPVKIHPLLTYPATAANNGDLPREGVMDDQAVDVESMIAASTIIVAMTQYSATAPLSRLCKKYPQIRVASMPGVLRRMEDTALAADYTEVARRTHLLADLLTRADGADIRFSTGQRVFFDLRFRRGFADDGQCRKGKTHPLINLPSGEAFIVPYEGECEDEPSMTRGVIPVHMRDEVFELLIESNRIVDVRGDGPEALAFTAHLNEDAARRNIAELGLGCNDMAVVMGAVIEDEKAGMHWAYGRSEHLGGTVSPANFSRPDLVVHQDIVYAPDSKIGIARLDLLFPDGTTTRVIEQNAYCVF